MMYACESWPRVVDRPVADHVATVQGFDDDVGVDHFLAQHHRCANAVPVGESTCVIAKDDTDKTHSLGCSADEVPRNGHTEIGRHCVKHRRRYRYWIDALSNQLALNTTQCAHLMNDVERP